MKNESGKKRGDEEDDEEGDGDGDSKMFNKKKGKPKNFSHQKGFGGKSFARKRKRVN